MNALFSDGALWLSASTMERATCWRRLWYYKVANRKPAVEGAGLIAGGAMHDALAALARGRTVQEQEKAISDALAKRPLPADDHRQPAYLHDALAQFRAEAPLAGWTLEEVETDGALELGFVIVDGPTSTPWRFVPQRVPVMWSFRRDAVGVAPDGRRYVVDYKTASRDEAAAYGALRNSGQFLGYLWSWNVAHPDRPAVGVLPVRIVMRAPTAKGKGVLYSFPQDPPLYFSNERVEQWRQSVLAFAGELLRLDPERPEKWRMAYSEAGLCRHQWGLCPYLETCCLSTERERAVHLASDAYADNVRDDKPTP